MGNRIFDDMMARYQCRNTEDTLHAVREIMQQITLAALARGGFFRKAAFYGGTCLRIFHGLGRFSEDMDFSLLAPDAEFSLEPWFDHIRNEFALLNQQVDISVKNKTHRSAIHSAFLKSNTAQYDIRLERGRLINIKLEVDTTPPLHFDTEEKLLLLPWSFYTRTFSLPCLFAGKMHALIFRNWKNRVKGRDWYDFEWYVRRGIPLHFEHFCHRAYQFGSAVPGSITPSAFLELLKNKLSTTSIEAVKQDVSPFIRDRSTLDIWSADYFLQLADMLQFQS